jgi:hypothetical protein
VLNWLVLLAAAGVLWALARELFPGRPWLQLGALAFFCFLPVVLRVGAMFHPEPLSMLLTAVALLLAVRMLGRRDYRWQLAVATGVVLGLGQLVRAFSLWTFAAVVLAFAVARAWRPLAFVVVATAVVASRGTSGRRSSTATLSSTGRRSTRRSGTGGRRASTSGSACRRSSPIPSARTSSTRRFRPRTATVWGTTSASGGEPRAAELPRPAADPGSPSRAGSSCCCARCAHRRGSRWLSSLGSGLLGYLYFTVGYPTPDGDVLKASYMLTTAPAWALAFGYALDRLPGRARLVVAGLLAASALAALPFLVY